MRQLYFGIFTFCAFSIFGQANKYHPFPDSNAVWCCSYVFSTGYCYYGHTTYIMNGKQTINNKVYNKIIVIDSTKIYQCLYPIYVGSSGSISKIFIRQDTNLKIVWIYDSISNSDKVLYDFNLNVGDTLDTSKAYFADGFGGLKIITSIDSVLINGSYRKRFNYNTGCTMFLPSDTSMIEGIGALHGLLTPPSCFELMFQLDAFHQDNNLLYGFQNSVCYSNPLSVLNVSNNKYSITIYPTPTTDQIYFENLPEEKISIKITNILGQIIYFTQIENKNNFSLSLYDQPSGLYFISIQTNTGETINKKIIKL
jgi:hypothetical protein